MKYPAKEKVGNRSLPIMSITMKEGLVDQSQKFKKRIASEDISLYKVVLKNELVVGFPIDEGVLGFLTQYDAGAVSPAYGIWRIRPEKRDFVDIDYLEMVMRSSRAIAAYKSKMQGAVSRRRSVPSHIFAKIPIPLPHLEVQKEIVAEVKGYQIQHALRQTIEQGLADNLLELALRGKPRDPFYMVGRLGEQSVVIRAEKGKLRMMVESHRWCPRRPRQLLPPHQV